MSKISPFELIQSCEWFNIQQLDHCVYGSWTIWADLDLFRSSNGLWGRSWQHLGPPWLWIFVKCIITLLQALIRNWIFRQQIQSIDPFKAQYRYSLSHIISFSRRGQVVLEEKDTDGHLLLWSTLLYKPLSRLRSIRIRVGGHHFLSWIWRVPDISDKNCIRNGSLLSWAGHPGVNTIPEVLIGQWWEWRLLIGQY